MSSANRSSRMTGLRTKVYTAGFLLLMLQAGAETVPDRGGEAVTLANGVLEVRFRPGTGRLERVRFTDGDNLLWRNDPGAAAGEEERGGWYNAGGEKVWPGPQPLWPFVQGRRWPPDRALDGMGVVKTERPDALTLIAYFPESPAWGITMRRELRLDPEHAVFEIETRFTATRDLRHPVQIWSVVQVPHPLEVRMEVVEAQPDGSLFINLNRTLEEPPFTPLPLPEGFLRGGGNEIVLRPSADERSKVGTLGREISAVFERAELSLSVVLDPEGMYPEFSSLHYLQNPRYAELETLGPAAQLKKGESITSTTVWTLRKRGE